MFEIDEEPPIFIFEGWSVLTTLILRKLKLPLSGKLGESR